MKNYFTLKLKMLALMLLTMPIVSIAQDTPAPIDLIGSVIGGNDAKLSWTAPGQDPTYLHWDDGVNADSWGFFTGNAIFDIAAKWDPEHIDFYDDWEIRAIRFYLTSGSVTISIKVWEGSEPTEVYSQTVSDFASNQWEEIEFDTPYTIDASKALWAGLNINQQFGGTVVGTDDGPAITGYGNPYRVNGTWYTDYNNHNLQILVAPKGAPRGSESLLGYNVYRDDEKINTNIVDNTVYVDKDLYNGTYEYYVTSVFDEGESDPSNKVDVVIDQPIILEADSLALIDLYNNCNGENWDLNINWLETMVSEWIGVTTKGTRVVGLSLSNNELTGDIPESFGDLTRLRDLYLSDNDIESLPTTFGNLESLYEFWMSRTLLTGIPSNIGDLDSLETLSLSDNVGLTELPASFGDMEMLSWFGMGRCSLESLPTSFGNLDNLEACWLDNNLLTELPSNFKDMSSLGYLGINDNMITALPEGFGDLTSLVSLNATNNMITALPASFGELSSLEVLIMYQNGLKTLSDNFGSLSSLQDLKLSINELETLPDSFGNLTSLIKCSLDQNMLTALPDNFGGMSSLVELSLSKNELTALPESIGDLDAMEVIFVVDNNLMSLPESISDLDAVVIMGLGKNEIPALPENIGNLTTLGYLDIMYNQIEVLPASMGDLTADTLLMSSNKIKEIPASMFDHVYKYLWVDDNALQFGSLEPFKETVTIEFLYEIQDKFGKDTLVYPEGGGTFEFTWDVSGENNVYQWFREGTLLDGQTTNTLTLADVSADDEGVYTLQVTNTLVTDLMIESYDVTLDVIVTGTPEVEINEMTIYPNPVTNNYVSINTGSTVDVAVQIIDINGKMMKEETINGQQSVVDISELPKGIYFVKVIDTTTSWNVSRLIKN